MLIDFRLETERKFSETNQEISKLREETTQKISELREETTQKISDVKQVLAGFHVETERKFSDITDKISQARAYVVMWMVGDSNSHWRCRVCGDKGPACHCFTLIGVSLVPCCIPAVADDPGCVAGARLLLGLLGSCSPAWPLPFLPCFLHP